MQIGRNHRQRKDSVLAMTVHEAADDGTPDGPATAKLAAMVLSHRVRERRLRRLEQNHAQADHRNRQAADEAGAAEGDGPWRSQHVGEGPNTTQM